MFHRMMFDTIKLAKAKSRVLSIFFRFDEMSSYRIEFFCTSWMIYFLGKHFFFFPKIEFWMEC